MIAARLHHYKQRLLELKQRIEGDIEELASEVASAGIVVGEHTSHTRDSIETELVLERNEESIQQHVRSALQRIETGTFGQCLDCGGRISRARLDALPFTPICIECERKREA